MQKFKFWIGLWLFEPTYEFIAEKCSFKWGVIGQNFYSKTFCYKNDQNINSIVF